MGIITLDLIRFLCKYTAWPKVLGQQKSQYRHNIRLVLIIRLLNYSEMTINILLEL